MAGKVRRFRHSRRKKDTRRETCRRRDRERGWRGEKERLPVSEIGGGRESDRIVFWSLPSFLPSSSFFFCLSVVILPPASAYVICVCVCLSSFVVYGPPPLFFFINTIFVLPFQLIYIYSVGMRKEQETIFYYQISQTHTNTHTHTHTHTHTIWTIGAQHTTHSLSSTPFC